MASIKDKLQNEYDLLTSIFQNVEWYASPNQLDTIDEKVAILNYTTENHGADSRVHFTRVTLTVYLANVDEHTEDLRELGYETSAETLIDEKLNTYQTFTKSLIIL